MEVGPMGQESCELVPFCVKVAQGGAQWGNYPAAGLSLRQFSKPGSFQGTKTEAETAKPLKEGLDESPFRLDKHSFPVSTAFPGYHHFSPSEGSKLLTNEYAGWVVEESIVFFLKKPLVKAMHQRGGCHTLISACHALVCSGRDVASGEKLHLVSQSAGPEPTYEDQVLGLGPNKF